MLRNTFDVILSLCIILLALGVIPTSNYIDSLTLAFVLKIWNRGEK